MVTFTPNTILPSFINTAGLMLEIAHIYIHWRAQNVSDALNFYWNV